MQPLIFEPVLKRIRWGGTRLGSMLGKPLGPESDYAESWEIADHGTDQSRVAEGPYRGMPLNHLVQRDGEELLGRQNGIDQFPLLIKYLDAQDWLSLQVHPNDAQARKFDPHENGKTEAWVVIDAAEDSRICAGLKPGVTAAHVRDAVQAGCVEECLHLIGVQPGDCVFVPAGTVHALGPGILLAEVQQQSNLTFRLHDWGRLGTDGKPRSLHLNESIACTDFNRGPVNPVIPTAMNDNGHAFEELVRSEYFVIRRHFGACQFEFRSGNCFRILMCLKGKGTLTSDSFQAVLRPGATILIPSACRHADVSLQDGAVLLEVLPPDIAVM